MLNLGHDRLHQWIDRLVSDTYHYIDELDQQWQHDHPDHQAQQGHQDDYQYDPRQPSDTPGQDGAEFGDGTLYTPDQDFDDGIGDGIGDGAWASGSSQILTDSADITSAVATDTTGTDTLTSGGDAAGTDSYSDISDVGYDSDVDYDAA